jgi:hypothetical protein
MPVAVPSPWAAGEWKPFTTPDRRILLLSILLQLALALPFGHSYDMRIFMATGYLVGTGQNPYVPQDLSAVFHEDSFQGITTVGYPPPWPLLLGLLYRGVYAAIPNLLVYNLAIKIPVVAANVGLAYLVAAILKNLGAKPAVCRRAWIFLLLNPLLLYFGSAWGQFDSIVALLSLAALVLLYGGRLGISAGLLALAISFKPTAVPIAPVVLAYLLTRSVRQAVRYSAVLLLGLLLFGVAPFLIFGWSPAPILQHWNAHFTVAGGMSFMTFFELLRDSYQLPGGWWLLGMVWIPALGVGLLALRRGIGGFEDLLKKSTGLVLIFFLTRAWLSEQNVVLILPLVLILTSIGELDGRALRAVWILPLIFTIFNGSPPQLLFPGFPDAEQSMIGLAHRFRVAGLVARTASVVPWQVAGWWIVATCLGPASVPAHTSADGAA